MATIDAPEYELPDIKDHQPTRVRITEIREVEGAEKYGSEPRLRIDLEFPDMPDAPSFAEFVGQKLGQRKSGEVSKLRAILNARCRRKETDVVYRFVVETGAVYHDREKQVVSARLLPGDEFIVRGKTVTNENGDERFRIYSWEPVPEQGTGGSVLPPQNPLKPKDEADEEVPFCHDW